MTWSLGMGQKFIIPRNKELLPLVFRSKYVVLGRLGACDGATNITYLLLFIFLGIYKKISVWIIFYKFNPSALKCENIIARWLGVYDGT